MRVLLKLVLDCPPDAAWRAIRSPEVMSAVSAPFIAFEPHEVPPSVWPAGEHPVTVKAFGRVPIGEQVIAISFPERDDDVRVMRDAGWGEGGPLSLVTRWEHSLSVAPAPGGRTLYRDQLIVEAGVLTPVLWVMYWAFWQWRGIRMSLLAHRWDATIGSAP